MASCEGHCFLRDLVVPPDICNLFLLTPLVSLASVVIRDRGIVCGVLFHSLLGRYRVSLFIRSGRDESCHFFFH